ncbi:MAG: hypothetical protein U9M94_03720 [Patescibacteria group bacterium]|nr:hypothetical protein [Patescibacteria group bacterium]
MLDTSKDTLNIVIAASVGIFAIFTCYAVFYFAQILRQGFKIVKEMRDRLHKVDSLIKTIKEKIEHSTSHIVLIAEGMKKLVEVIKERTEKRKDSKDNKK